MPAWDELLRELNRQSTDEAKGNWVNSQRQRALTKVSELRDGRNVIFYGSAFLQKSGAPAESVSIHPEDLNGVMSVIHGMDCSKGLTLLLHTPGGNPNAAETLVSYLRSKFDAVEVIVPTMAMSAGTMISLAADHIIMGRQSQLGPIDPQFSMGGRFMSARGVVEQFKRATEEILGNPDAAHVWAPVTQSLGPALLQDAQNALEYSETMVARWLTRWMFASEPDAEQRAAQVAMHFNDASTHKSHGRRIDYDEVAGQQLSVSRLEESQPLQEAVLTLYHLQTILFEQSAAAKTISGSNGRHWVKNVASNAA